MNWEFSESYGLYHVTAAPHAEPAKNGGAFKESYTALKKGKIDTLIDTIMHYNIKTLCKCSYCYYFVVVCLG